MSNVERALSKEGGNTRTAEDVHNIALGMVCEYLDSDTTRLLLETEGITESGLRKKKTSQPFNISQPELLGSNSLNTNARTATKNKGKTTTKTKKNAFSQSSTNNKSIFSFFSKQ